ncbi:hypothetical protein BH23PLA1_BH23PLA1_34870 [soil metagenome]
MAIPDEELASALTTLLQLNGGFYVGFADMIEIGQLENLNYWAESRDEQGKVIWSEDDLSMKEAIEHFLRIRKERELGYDIEMDLNPESSL